MRFFADPAEIVDDPWLAEAYRLAERGRGATSPNPIVGCVVVQGERIVGSGFHARAGGPHAEVVALESAGAAARGAHVAVTLEPCNHEGRTGPCAEALLAAGIASVAIGMRDPNPSVVGGGADRLRAGGVRVEMAADPEPFQEQNAEWLKWLESGSPFVRAKIALTLDGKPALAVGERASITGRGGSRITMRLRSASDAVVVGANTLAVDDPALTVRDEHGKRAERQPLRVVLSRLTVPDPAASLFHDGAGRVVVLASDAVSLEDAGRLHAAGGEVLHYPSATGLAGALETLGAEGVLCALVEPGPGLFAALWDSDLIDELVVLSAGGLGGAESPGLYPWTIQHVGDELERRMHPAEAGVVGESVVSVWKRTSGPSK